MEKIKIRTLALSAIVLTAGVSSAWAGQITTLAALNANDSIDWGQFGTAGTTLNSPSMPNFVANFSNSANTANIYPGGVVQSANPVTYGFSGTALALDNQFTGEVGAIFSTPVDGFGFYIASAFGGAFTATVEVVSSKGTFAATYNEPGGPSNPVTFLGALDPTADISGFIVSMTNGSGNNYFALDTIEVADATVPGNVPPGPSSGTPEPASFLLAGSALAGLFALRIRNRK